MDQEFEDMAGRIRSIKPELLDDEVSCNLSDGAWRLFVSSWLLADDHGNLRAGEKYLAAQVWQDTTRDVSVPVGELVTTGLWKTYVQGGQHYANIPSWGIHQRIDNAGKPRVPPPEWQPTNNLDVSDNLARKSASRGNDQGLPQSSPLDLRPPTSDQRTPRGAPTRAPARNGAPAAAAPESVPDYGIDPRQLAIEAELLRHRVIIACLGSEERGERFAADVMAVVSINAKPEWLVQAIREAVCEIEEGWTADATRRLLRKYIQNARPPKPQDQARHDLPPDPDDAAKRRAAMRQQLEQRDEKPMLGASAIGDLAKQALAKLGEKRPLPKAEGE